MNVLTAAMEEDVAHSDISKKFITTVPVLQAASPQKSQSDSIPPHDTVERVVEQISTIETTKEPTTATEGTKKGNLEERKGFCCQVRTRQGDRNFQKMQS